MKTRSLPPCLLALAWCLGVALDSSAATIPNPSFEANSFTNSPGYYSQTGNGAIGGWVVSGGTGLNPANGNPFADNGAVPDGANVAFIQSGTNSSLSTVISNLSVGETYKVNFRVNARNAFGGTPNLKVSIAGTNIINSAVTPVGTVGSTNPYKYFAFDFTAAATNQTMTLINDAGPDQTVLLDNFSIALRDSGWSYAAWNDDASSGLDGTKTYTHAYRFGATGSATINGVTFTGTGSATVNPSVANSFSTAGLTAVFNNDNNNVGGTSWQLATNFLYGGTVESITISNLHLGNSYVATIYSVGFVPHGLRAATFSVGNDRLTVNQDQFGNDNGIRVSYAYTASAQSLTISNSALHGSFTFHTYGFSNAELTNARAAFLIVTNLADSGPGTLRQVIAYAEQGETITFNPALSGQTNVLTSGQLLIPYNLTIDASALPGGFKISGNHSSRVFEVAAGAVVTLNSLTIQDGSGGGGIFSYGTLTINSSTFSGNSASVGGGIYNGFGGTLTINGSTFSGNSASATGFGGGIYNENGSTLTINGSTFSGNSASGGGGIYNNGGNLSLTNTIVAGNSAPFGPNISGSFSGANNLTNGTPLLAPLDNYGGPTATMRPRPGSPAIDAGLDSITNLLATDQRGYPRRFGAHVDIGAVEAQVTVVSNLNDSGVGSLRAALGAPMELIGFATNLAGGTITLTSGQIHIFNNVTVDATALAPGLTVSGNHASRIFHVSARVTVASLTLMNGNDGSGGAIFMDAGGTLTLNSVAVSGNSAGEGGAIFSIGTLTINSSTFSGNSTIGGGGGGIYFNGGTLTINGSTFSGNSASGNGVGGGIYIFAGTLTINGSTFSGNSASGNGVGGGIYIFAGTLTINGSTFSGNSAADRGGGIFSGNDSTFTINGSTFSGNSASGGGGLYLSGGNSHLTNTIVAGNSAPSNPDIFASFSGANNLTGGDPLLAPLGNYGGSTPTMPPLFGSPAIDTGLDAITNFLATDQRGYPRRSGAHVDIGAVEFQVVSAANAPVRINLVEQPNGALMFGFTSSPDASFTVLASTNIALPLAQWSNLGPAVQSLPGQYQFSDSAATNYPQRFYRVVSP